MQDFVFGYPVIERRDNNYEFQAGPFRLPGILMMTGEIDGLRGWERELAASFGRCVEPMYRRFVRGPE